jgi:hypothetical protein
MIHKTTTESLMSGTMKFHLKAAKAFEQYGRKEDAKAAKGAAEKMRKRLEK